ncbi:MAG: hypothetical protein PHN34_12215 [Kiritimatiellae bacterium]|nr:hypothetical protein [Kiritimatiellia bacterium]
MRRVAGIVCLLAATASALHAKGLRLLLNPYDGVKWEQVTQHKANLHTHTVASGGKLLLNQVFAEYAQRGYTILAITDHDLCTQWQKADINPMKEYGILPVMGQEYSKGHHINGFFVNFETRASDSELVLLEIVNHGGVAVINHPGRYWKPDADGRVPQGTRNEYLRLLNGNPLALGIEVINKNDRYPHDVLLWDALLEVAMPARPVWGFANDDMHERKQIGHSWETFLLDRLDSSELRHAMLKGHFYFSSRGNDHDQDGFSEPPVIQSIVHDPVSQTLTLSAAADGAVLDAEHYRWIANGQTIMVGPALKYNETEGVGRYVRAEIESAGGKTYTNPFGFGQTE